MWTSSSTLRPFGWIFVFVFFQKYVIHIRLYVFMSLFTVYVKNVLAFFFSPSFFFSFTKRRRQNPVEGDSNKLFYGRW